MDDDQRKEEALFRLSVLGDLVHRNLKHGELKAALQAKAAQVWIGPDGKERILAPSTIQNWYYLHRDGGFEGLLPKIRKDKGVIKAIPPQIQSLILDMKREDPGRSAFLILWELTNAGVIRKGAFSETTVRRLLKQRGLSGPKMELAVPGRLRFVATNCGDLWQGDACHGPKLFDPASGREVRVKIFALLDDKSRMILYARAGFHETQEEFLLVLLEAVSRWGLPAALLLDNHGSFTGTDTRLACAKLGIQLKFTRPYDGPSKGKIERFWRTFRSLFLERIDWEKIKTLDDLNLRLWTWIEEFYNLRPHHGLSGRTPLSVWEEEADQIRRPEEDDFFETAFTATVTRKAKKDSTFQFRGKTYEVPQHLRGKDVTFHYSLLRPEILWIEEGETQVFLREVDPQANFYSPRIQPKAPKPQDPPATGLNSVEDLMDSLFHPKEGKPEEEEEEEEEEGADE